MDEVFANQDDLNLDEVDPLVEPDYSYGAAGFLYNPKDQAAVNKTASLIRMPS
jgi:hypothetical protein